MYPNLCFLTEVSYKEDESTMGEESQRVLLSQDKCRIQTGSHPALFLSKPNLCLWLQHTRHSGKTHLNMCELETSGNYSDLPSLKNPRNGDWENCHSPLDRTIPQKWTFLLWRWCWHPTVSGHQDEFPLQVFSSQSVFRETMITKQEITVYLYLIHSTGLLWEGLIAWLPKRRNYAELVSPEKQKLSGHF